MSARERLETYLAALRRRLRAQILAQSAAAIAAGTLAITVAAVWLFAQQEFAPSIVIAGRAAILLLVVAVVAFLLWLPLRKLSRDEGAGIFEQRVPAEDGRIQTYLDARRREASGQPSVLLDLLAADAASIAEKTAPPGTIVPSHRLGVVSAVAIIGAAGLLVLLSAGPAYWGFGARHLLLGAPLPRSAVPIRRITVTPGDATVRRNSDLLVKATVEGFHPREAQVFVRFSDQQQWEKAAMQAKPGEEASQFEFKLYAVRGPLQYYVDAEGTRSGEHHVAVVDLPRIERVRLTYSYPEWTGLAQKTDDTSRDISAVEGTNVHVEVFADAPLEAPALIVDGTPSELSQQGGASTGTIEVKQPGSYQIGARVANEFVALSDEYTIEIVPDEKPVIEIRKPSRDLRATSIEEVPVRISAEDDFRLRDVSLRYSVNGGEWKSVRVGGGVKQTNGESLLNLEELGAAQEGADGTQAGRLVPGDLISYYAVAKDRRETVQTDLFMVQVQPFERRFTQAQAGAGGGGMGEDQGAISERQREILLATWNLQRNDERNARTRQQLRDSATMLAELQTTLAQQARTLAQRTRARAMVDQDERVRAFVDSLERAAEVMDPAAKHLSAFELQAAVPVEQQALQQLLRAESAFREVQVSMQQNGSGNAGAEGARNFAEMFELEMDLEKNQYESESQLSMRNTQKDLDEALRKLKELAERQERLANERQQDLLTPEQRWKQEQLRREAEDLRRRLAQLQRQQSSQSAQEQARSQSNQQSAQQSNQESGQQSAQQSGQRAGQQSNDGRATGGARGERDPEQRRQEQLAQALESVNQALEQMQAANNERQDNSQNANGQDPSGRQQAGTPGDPAEQAGRNLRKALKQFDRPEPSRIGEALAQFADQAQGMVEEQRRIENDLYDALSQSPDTAQRFGARGGVDQRRAQELVRSKQQLADNLTGLQRDMRNAVHEHRERSPEGTRRLSEIIRDIEGSDVMYRLNRSAAEIYYGRAREAAPREGLITEALDALEQNLREAAAQAAQEKKGGPGVTADTLLAEVAQLRRALQQSQRADQRMAREQGQAGERGDSAERAQPQSSGQQRARDSQLGGQDGRGLAAWSPSSPAIPGDFDTLGHSLAPQTAQLSDRVRELTQRMSKGSLTQAELEALRRMGNQLRRLAGDPMADQREEMLKLIDQIELAALAASGHESGSARATMPAAESARYRDTVAEYYRRLGER